MTNDKQIAFTELRLQYSSEKFLSTVVSTAKKNNFPECLNPHFVFIGILSMIRFVIIF